LDLGGDFSRPFSSTLNLAHWYARWVFQLEERSSMTEKHYRSVVKAISWRATGTVDTILISFLITGHASLALKIGFVELFTKIALYYVHERVWNKLSFGRVKAKEEYSI
jgi:uncharacterized membrane protein